MLGDPALADDPRFETPEQYTAWMLGIAMLSILSPFVLGRPLKLRGKRLVRLIILLSNQLMAFYDVNTDNAKRFKI